MLQGQQGVTWQEAGVQPSLEGLAVPLPRCARACPWGASSSSTKCGLAREGQGSEVDVSDLGSRNYSARTDFYCLRRRIYM